MTNRLALPVLLLAAVAASACSTKRIPGTEIRDTKDNRAVYEVVDQYVHAMNKRDADAVLALVSPDYFDDAGTPDPSDDLDRDRLQKTLAQDLGRVETERLAVTLRKIEVTDGTAYAEIFFDNYYRVQTPAGAIPRRDSDVHRIRLKKIDGQWKIYAGL
jgi:ketosteroid isomerase-like protein